MSTFMCIILYHTMTTFVKIKRRNLMSSEDFVPSELRAKASEKLQQEVEAELQKPDPPKEKASAALNKAINPSEKTSERFKKW